MPALVQVSNLKKDFPVRATFFSRTEGNVHAVDDVTFDVFEQETLGLVGESGCGKSTVAKLILRLVEPTSGRIVYDGTDLTRLDEETLRRKFRPKMQIVFQDYSASLNPRKTIRYILSRACNLQEMSYEATDDRIHEALSRVGLEPADMYLDRYPHEFSGGQRQRINIARALTLQPTFVVLDEPVSALDMSVRAQLLILLKKLKEDLRLTYLFITHDLSVVRSLCDRVIVMYLGKIMETGRTDEIFRNPLHPYTKALLSATPTPDPRRTRSRERIILEGDIPSPINPPPGCRFSTRCPIASEECTLIQPELTQIGERMVACIKVSPLTPRAS